MNNVTGWNELYNGNIISAVYSLFDASLLGWSVAILFFAFQIILYIKTRNVTLSWITGLFFASLFAVSTFVKQISIQAMYLTLVIELACIFFLVFIGKRPN